MVCAFNKIDSVPCAFAEEWMNDFESFQDAIDCDREEYMGSLNRSLSLAMDEFYKWVDDHNFSFTHAAHTIPGTSKQ